MQDMSENRSWFITIATMVVTISILHYVTSARFEADQVVYAKLYYIPVTLAAVIYGLRGGLIAATLVALIYGPSLAFQQFGPKALLLDFALDLVLLFAVGVLVGTIVNRDREHHRRAHEAERLASLGKAAAMMAHEMKSPLVAIGGFARMLLRRNGLVRESREDLEVIKVESARLERLVHDALDFARFQPVRLEWCRVDDLLNRTRDVIRLVAETNGVSLVESCDSPELGLNCDLERMVQVLINLIDNAVHFTPRGGSVHLSLCGKPMGMLHVEVRDSGQGIPEDMLENLFEPFAGRREGGSGLGLAIAQRIVQAHGGRIEVRNLPHGGASFWFDLPGCARPPGPEEVT
jgi:two-component system sensor histidine kinase HydH